ncbi:MAG: EamA family transporter [Negativicutes bacterium]|nr:EamA family transporter [Negativicutes bacterium]
MSENFWLLPALLAAVFAAMVPVFGKIGLDSAPATAAAVVRSLIMSAVLLTAALGGGHWRDLGWFVCRPQSLAFIIFSGLAGGLSWLCYFVALKHGPVAKVAAADKLSVAIAAVAALLLGERLSAVSATGIALITIGAVMVALG